MGLGLSTVYGIVQGRGGDVDVRSEEGRGTTFDLWFPEGPPPAPVSRRAVEQATVVAPGTTVLVVEDSAVLPKPVEPELLLPTIARAVGGR